MRYTRVTRVTWNLYLRPCGLRIQKGVSSSRLFFGYCKLWWSMLSDVGATDPRKMASNYQQKGYCMFSFQKNLGAKEPEREREREWEDKTYHSDFLNCKLQSCGNVSFNYTSTIQGGPEISLAHWMMWDSSQLRVVFVCQCQDEKTRTMSPTLGDLQCSSDVCSWDTDL